MKNKYNADQEEIGNSLFIIGQIMKKARINAGLSIQDLADKLGVRREHISRCENGKISYSMEFYLSWKAALNVNL